MKLIIAQKEDLEVLVKTSVHESIKEFFAQKDESDSDQKHLTVKETAVFLNVTELTVRNYIKRGLISAKKIGNRVLIDRKKLENTLKEVKSLKYLR
ncbi:MAG: hypothetical protein CMC14_11350 [Flavobacteriaceae bacterium]|nr:hypothetical protein [Flavobacteriaceae bacterium]